MRPAFWLALAALSLTSPVSAQSRPDSLAMTCDQARALVARAGGIVLGTGPNIYDRYVASAGFCPPGDVMRNRTVPTRDTGACPVGGTCETPFGNPRMIHRY
ncbi:MAG: hypothetical protein ACRCUX_14060 [Beijerinckiaceae bacterium]